MQDAKSEFSKFLHQILVYMNCFAKTTLGICLFYTLHLYEFTVCIYNELHRVPHDPHYIAFFKAGFHYVVCSSPSCAVKESEK